MTCQFLFYSLLSLLAGLNGSGPEMRVLCDTPVFRYALEAWEPDDYVFFILCKGEAPFSSLDFNGHTVNLALQPIDPVLALKKLSIGEKAGPIPWMVVVAPGFGRNRVVWQGPAKEGKVEGLVFSKARKALVKMILSGESAVWVLKKGKDARRNRRVLKILGDSLEKMPALLELPKPADQYEPGPGPEVKISFSILEVDPDDPDEAVFVKCLRLAAPGINDKEWNGPVAFPVFGRGRVLCAVPEEKIDAHTIHEACRFLVGPCACQIKDQNPGMDLLLGANWPSFDEQVGFVKEIPLPPLTSLKQAVVEKKTVNGSSDDIEDKDLNGKEKGRGKAGFLVYTMLALLISVLVLLGLLVIQSRRGSG